MSDKNSDIIIDKINTSENVAILIIDNNEADRIRTKMDCTLLFSQIGSNKDSYILEASNIENAFNLLMRHRFDIIILDKNTAVSGLDLIQQIKIFQPWSQILLLTTDLSYKKIAKAIQLGVSDYLEKESNSEYSVYRNEILLKSLNRAKIEFKITDDKSRRSDIYPEYVCNSSTMLFFDQKLNAIAESTRPVLLVGAIGLGKGAAARRINEFRSKLYNQRNRPFMNIDVDSLNESFIQSELYGVEPNTITDVGYKVKSGFFDFARGGDIFIDDIGSASKELQQELLNVVEEESYIRVGGRNPIKTDVCFIFATNKNLKDLVTQGIFRLDLYMKISVFELALPRLEDRKEDLEKIIQLAINKILKKNTKKNINIEDFPTDLIDFLTRDNINGNISGIENDIYRLITFAQPDNFGRIYLENWRNLLGLETKVIRKKQITNANILDINLLKKIDTRFVEPSSPGLKALKAIFERRVVEEAMIKFDHNLKLASQHLKVAQSVLHTKIKQFKIPTKREILNELEKSRTIVQK